MKKRLQIRIPTSYLHQFNDYDALKIAIERHIFGNVTVHETYIEVDDKIWEFRKQWNNFQRQKSNGERLRIYMKLPMELIRPATLKISEARETLLRQQINHLRVA